MRRRIATLLILLIFFGNAASAEWIPLWQKSETEAMDEGFERVHSISAQWNGFPLLNDDLNAFIKSMLDSTIIEYTLRKTEDVGYARWDWLLQKVSVLDFSIIVQDELLYEQSNLFAGQTLSFTKPEFSDFIFNVSQLSGGILPNQLDLFFDLMRYPWLGDTKSLQTLQEAFRMIDEWKEKSIVISERARPSVSLPGLFGTSATVYQISRADFFSLLESSANLIQSDDRQQVDANSDTERMPQEAREAFLSLKEAIFNPEAALSGFLSEDMPPIEFREIYCYQQSVSKQLEIQSGSDWLLIEWTDQSDSVAVSFQYGNIRASALFTFEEDAPVVTRKLQSVQRRSLLEMRIWVDDISLTAYRTDIKTFENAGTKETIRNQIKWMIDSESLFGTEGPLILSLCSTDETTGEGLKYKRAIQTDVALTGLQFDGNPLIQINETVAFRKPSDAYFAEENVLHPGQMSQQALEDFFEGLRNDALQVCFTILGRVPSENAQYLLTFFDAARQGRWGEDATRGAAP